MNTSSKLLCGLFITLATVSCITGNKKEGKNLLKDCPVVAQYVQVGDDNPDIIRKVVCGDFENETVYH